jgi:hypothetical protein
MLKIHHHHSRKVYGIYIYIYTCKNPSLLCLEFTVQILLLSHTNRTNKAHQHNKIAPTSYIMSPSLPFEHVDIIDIRQDDFDGSLVKDIYNGLNPQDGGQRTLPTLLLYDCEGLRLFEKITYLDEYYLTNAEIEVLTTHAKAIVEQIPENSQLVELGSGCVSFYLELGGYDSHR